MSSPVLRNYDCNYKVYALLLVHSIGSFLSSIAALCLPIFGTYLCSEMGPVSALSYSDSADMQVNKQMHILNLLWTQIWLFTGAG